MVSTLHLESVKPRIAAIGGGACALIVGVAIVLTPNAILEILVRTSGIAALASHARPPLGMTAHAVLAIIGGGLSGAVAWSVLYLVFGRGGFLVQAKRGDDAPLVVRRADAHPDAPPRRPICAADLGEPIITVPHVERPLPIDLEQPLAAFDPAAILPAPRAPVRPVAPLSRPQSDARIETFALPPIAISPPRPLTFAVTKAEPVATPSIETLLRRLEQGARARELQR